METYIEPYKPPSMASLFKKKSNFQLVQPQISSSSNASENTEPIETNFPNSFNEIQDQENFLKEKDLASLKLILGNIKINREFLTQDNLNDKRLIDILINLSGSWKECSYYKDTYLSGKICNTRNIVSEHMNKVDSLVKEMKLKVEECIKCNVAVKGDNMATGMSYLKKAECVKKIICTGTNLLRLLTDKTFLKTVKKSLGYQSKHYH